MEVCVSDMWKEVAFTRIILIYLKFTFVISSERLIYIWFNWIKTEYKQRFEISKLLQQFMALFTSQIHYYAHWINIKLLAVQNDIQSRWLIFCRSSQDIYKYHSLTRGRTGNKLHSLSLSFFLSLSLYIYIRVCVCVCTYIWNVYYILYIIYNAYHIYIFVCLFGFMAYQTL